MSTDRRTFVRTLLSASVVGAAGTSLQAQSLRSRDKPDSMVAWMDAWTGVKARDPEGGLFVYRFKDPMWALLKSISWIPNVGESGISRVDVPVGFVTDFASIPRAFWSALPPDGEYAYAAVCHDYLYWFQERSRVESDEVFRRAMMDFNIGSGTVLVIYKAVRAFGQSAWDENARLRLAGEKRVLAKFPDDPRITWDNWKRTPDVFKA
jgi:hypothetical protein